METTISARIKKDFDAIIFSVLCILGIVFTLLDDFCDVHTWLEDDYFGGRYIHGSFMFECSTMATIVIVVIAVLLVLRWLSVFGIIKNVTTKTRGLMGIIGSVVCIALVILGAMIIDSYYPQITDTVSGIRYFEYIGIMMMFWFELGILVLLLVLSIINCTGKNVINFKERQPKEKKVKTVANTIVKNEVKQSEADEIAKYKNLLDQGAITQEEFEAKKKQLLGL